MIARGDLGMELMPEETVIAQKMMTFLCRKHSKPVIVATQMLESMIQNARPTRAEIADITNAVLDSNDAVMLSGETSIGNFPSESVKVMRNISQSVENCRQFDFEFDQKEFNVTNEREAIIESGVEMSLQYDSEFLIVLSKDSLDARYTASLRPKSIILAPFNDIKMLRFFELFNGLYGVLDSQMDNNEEKIRLSHEHAINMRFISRGQKFKAVVIDCDNLKVYPFETE